MFTARNAEHRLQMHMYNKCRLVAKQTIGRDHQQCARSKLKGLRLSRTTIARCMDYFP